MLQRARNFETLELLRRPQGAQLPCNMAGHVFLLACPHLSQGMRNGNSEQCPLHALTSDLACSLCLQPSLLLLAYVVTRQASSTAVNQPAISRKITCGLQTMGTIPAASPALNVCGPHNFPISNSPFTLSLLDWESVFVQVGSTGKEVGWSSDSSS